MMMTMMMMVEQSVECELARETEVYGENLPQYHLLPVEWPARWVDLTPINFFLWGYKKDQVYGGRVTRSQDLEKKTHRIFCGRNHASNLWQRFLGI
jgi:hypothetical protein